MVRKFHFKQFSVSQDNCAMKIGTDGVLLGTWTGLDHCPGSILDIGTGTGVIALMMAQRSRAVLIDGVEIDAKAHQQCVENFENSPWRDRLFCYHADFKTFVEEIGAHYQLIVCNPPFFNPPKNAKRLSPERQKARFTTHLSFPELIEGAARLLDRSGQFSLIIPYPLTEEIIATALEKNLHLQKTTLVKGNQNAPIKRNLLQFGFNPGPVKRDELVIETDRHHYTADYKGLTKDFYLKM